MKAIIFDIDWVVIKSDTRKNEIIIDVLQKYNIYNQDWVKEIIAKWLNRKELINEIYKLQEFDKQLILDEISVWFLEIELNPVPNNLVIDFIKENKDKYIIATNSVMPIIALERVLNSLWLSDCFSDILASETWTKTENIAFVVDKYNLPVWEVLFVDDNINHINNIIKTWVDTLHYTSYDIDINDYLR